MSKLTRIVAAGAALVVAGSLAATEAMATEGYFQNGLGARHKGMAGAGVANGQDATTQLLNPAALVRAGDSVNISASIFMPFRQYAATAPTPPFEFLAAGTVKSNKNFFPVPNLAYSRRIDDVSAWGIALSGNGGMNTSYPNVANAVCASPPFPAASGAFCGGKAGVDMMQVSLSGTYARDLGKYFSVGISPILTIQRFKARGILAFGALSSNPAALSNRGYSYSVGVGARIGVEFRPTERLRIGAAYQTETLMTRFKKYAGLFAERGDFDVPASFQVGVAWDATEQLTLMLDYRRIFYSGVRSLSNTATAGGPLGAPNGAGFGWKDVNTIKIGAEFKANEYLTVRGGYSYNNSPIPASQVFFNVLAPAVSQHHITAGATYKISPNSEIEFAGMFSPSAKQTGIVGPGGQVATIKMHQIEATIGYNYHFR